MIRVHIGFYWVEGCAFTWILIDDDGIGVCSLNFVLTLVGESGGVSTTEGANFEDDAGGFTSV